jgi:YD repeat-containing protein
VGNVLASKDALGESTFYEYDGLHRQVAVENALGQRTARFISFKRPWQAISSK